MQFWSSSSYDVDGFMENLLAMYKKYHNKGLDIVGVSSDSVDTKWKRAIRFYELPWPQVSDLKGRNGIVNNVYQEYGYWFTTNPNTTNVLLDNKGNIVAYDKYGMELQWYLEKLLGGK